MVGFVRARRVDEQLFARIPEPAPVTVLPSVLQTWLTQLFLKYPSQPPTMFALWIVLEDVPAAEAVFEVRNVLPTQSVRGRVTPRGSTVGSPVTGSRRRRKASSR